jgi:hypothetical protein
LSSSSSTDSSISPLLAPRNYMNYIPNNFGSPQIAHLDLGYSPKTDQQNSSRAIPLQRSISSKAYCPVCDKGFSKASNMNRHRTTEHVQAGLKPYKCQFCNEAFKRRDQRSAHERRMHANSVSSMVPV